MSAIQERREVRVHGDETDFVFVVEPERGRLAIRQEDGDDDVCSLEVTDSDQLFDFMEGLRRVLAPFGTSTWYDDRPAASVGTDGRSPDRRPPNGPSDATESRSDDDRIARARERNANAFKAWTPDEERVLLDAYREGRSVRELAQELGRWSRAVAMRLQRLGVHVED